MDVNSNGVHPRTQSILDFAKYLQHELGKCVEDIPTLATYLEVLISSPLHDATHEERSQLHQAGVELWNSCRQDDDDDSKQHKSLLAQGIFSNSSPTTLVLIRDQSKPSHTLYSESLPRVLPYAWLRHASTANNIRSLPASLSASRSHPITNTSCCGFCWPANKISPQSLICSSRNWVTSMPRMVESMLSASSLRLALSTWTKGCTERQENGSIEHTLSYNSVTGGRCSRVLKCD